MTLRPGEEQGRGIAVFPFLKTSGTIQLGNFVFRSTDDTSGLEPEAASHVRDIAEMLFQKDHLRIRSASYGMLPRVEFERSDPTLLELERIQAIVAYCYSAPRHTFGDIFFHSEHASLAIFSPQPVTTFLLRPDHHVSPAIDLEPLQPDQFHRVSGYEGRYNFRSPFWVAKGSRLYPPVPHITMNDSQHLAGDLGSDLTHAPQHHLLFMLIKEPLTANARRVVSAIQWYNRANSYLANDSEAILALAVGFETLLGLPRDGKTDRFIDAISLLLGRVPRLNAWAVQFYAARSDVAHEGLTERLRLMPTVQKPNEQGPEYQSLMSYGRQIFQLCVGTVLFGAHLAERSELHEKLTTNQERLELICKTLSDGGLSPTERFTAIDDIVAAVEQYRYVIETDLKVDTMTGALRAAAKNLLECEPPADPPITTALNDIVTAKKTKEGFEVLVAIEAWYSVMPKGPLEPKSPTGITRRLTEIVWHYNFVRYFQIKLEREATASAGSASAVHERFMTLPKQQHWVPRFYLRFFATPETAEADDAQAWLLSKDGGDPLLTNIKNVAAKRYLYSPKDDKGGRDAKTESKLADYEGLLKGIWHLLASDFVDLEGNQSIRKALALFISLLYLRHPKRLEQTERIHRQITQHFDSFPKDQNGNPDISEIEHKGVVRPFDASDWNKYRQAGLDELKKMFVDTLNQNATYLAGILMEKRWSVVFSDQPVFITTDSPVTILNPHRERFGFTSPGTLVSFPISPTRVLMLDDRHDQPAGQYYPLAATGPGIPNGLAWGNCERFMISPRHPDLVCAEILATAESGE